MDLLDELKAIWAKYETQMAAERNAEETRVQAATELMALNQKRTKVGLPVVMEHQSQSMTNQGMGMYCYPPAKTWRDDMQAEMMVAIRKAFEGT
jgi:hypothetical protein